MNRTTIILGIITINFAAYTIISLLNKRKKKPIDNLELKPSVVAVSIDDSEIETEPVPESNWSQVYSINMPLQDRELYLDSLVFLYE